MLSNRKCKIQPTLSNLDPNEQFHYYSFAVKLDRCVRSCNTLNDLSNNICILNRREDLNLNVFNMITGINESETLTKQISCEYECKMEQNGTSLYVDQNVSQINGGVTSVDVSVKKILECEQYFWNPAACNCENGKYLASIMDDSTNICEKDNKRNIKETNL